MPFFILINESAGPRAQGPEATVVSLPKDHSYQSINTVSFLPGGKGIFLPICLHYGYDGDTEFRVDARTDSGKKLDVYTSKGRWKLLRPGDRIKTAAKMGYFNRSEIVEYRVN
jgi:hypothetical protein